MLTWCFPWLLLLWVVASCEEPLPKEETLYQFPFKTKVDALRLGCSYEDREKCGDELKREVRREIGPINTAEQKKMGEAIHQEHFMSLLLEDAAYNERAEAVVERLLPHLARPYFDHDMYVIEDETFGAFTIPGGNIYITTGALDVLSTDDELAFVLGHELGHNENHHTAEIARLIRYVEQLEGGDVLDQLRSFFTRHRAQYCNPSDELDADIAAIYLMYAAGYDPERAVSVMQLLRQLDPRPSWGVERWLYELVRTHPWSEDRFRCIRRYWRASKVVVKCAEKYPKKTYACLHTRRDPLNVRRYPSTSSEVLGQFLRGETITLCAIVLSKPMGCSSSGRRMRKD